MISIESNIKEVIARIKRFIESLQPASEDLLGQTVENIKTQMQVEGKPITYPVQWDSERQRRAFFATGGFGKGIPYQRTGGYIAAWKHEVIPFGHTLSNPHPAGAIGGMPAGWQSRIHRGRWTYLIQVLSDELAKLPDRISNMLKVLAGRD